MYNYYYHNVESIISNRIDQCLFSNNFNQWFLVLLLSLTGLGSTRTVSIALFLLDVIDFKASFLVEAVMMGEVTSNVLEFDLVFLVFLILISTLDDWDFVHDAQNQSPVGIALRPKSSRKYSPSQLQKKKLKSIQGSEKCLCTENYDLITNKNAYPSHRRAKASSSKSPTSSVSGTFFLSFGNNYNCNYNFENNFMKRHILIKR